MRCSLMSRRRRSSSYGWLRPGEMLDGLGMAETTPGPLIMVTQFVGFMGASRQAGGLDSDAGRDAGRDPHHLGDLPAVLPLDLPRRALSSSSCAATGRSNAALSAITAAVVGVVLNLAIWFALHTLFAEVRPVEWGLLDFELPALASVKLPALLLTLAALFAMFRLKIGALWVLAGCAAAGMAVWAVAPGLAIA